MTGEVRNLKHNNDAEEGCEQGSGHRISVQIGGGNSAVIQPPPSLLFSKFLHQPFSACTCRGLFVLILGQKRQEKGELITRWPSSGGGG